MKRKLLCTALAALPLITLADEASLATIVITGRSAEPATAGSIGPRQLRAQQAATSDTASLLKDVPGVSLYGAGGASSLPVIHGLADDRLRIKVDGMDLVASCPNHMNPALSYLDPSNVAKLKVYAGIAPVSVGGDSIGGTILAETPAPEFATAAAPSLFKGEIGGFYRSNGGATGGNLSATAATETFSLSYSGSIAKSDNYEAGGKFKTRTDTGRTGHSLDLDEVGSTAYETRNQTLGIAFKNGQHLLEAKLGRQDVPEQLFPNQRMDMLKNTQDRLNLRYAGEFAWGALEARVYQEKVDHFMDFGADKQFQYGTAPGMPMNTVSKTTGLSINANLDLRAGNQLRLGTEFQHYALNDWWPPSGTGMMSPNAFININDGQRNRSAVFGEWEQRASAQWLSVLGLRYEHVSTDASNVAGYAATNMMGSNQLRDSTAFNARDRSKTDHNWDLTALARYTASATYDIEFGVARKTRSPNLYERYTWSTWGMAAIMNNFNGDGNGYLGDVELKPEVAHTASATFDWHAADRNWGFKATPYYTRVADYIDAVQWDGTSNVADTTPAVGAFSVLKYRNQSARLYGLDLSGHLPLATTALGEFGLKGVLNYVNGKNRDTGDDLYNIMPLNTRLTLTQTLGNWSNSAELVTVKSKNHVSDVRNEIATGGYSLINLRASYAWAKARIDVGVENLFDKRYDLPLGGAYVGQGSTMSTNTANLPWGIAVPGAGRSLYAGFNLKF
ncbi:MAG: TonB-dependent receptor [Rhodocyclaceae bacterium]|nr:TonB-dependent receptor [Rhodocyclaceae bacterium]